MPDYIDGFSFPIPTNRLEDYQRVAEAIAEIWKEHGALAYYEYSGDDMHLEGTASFPEVLAAENNETIIFGWVVFESREARDQANERVSADPRVEQLMATDTGFNPGKMAFGGFKPLIKVI